MERVEPPKGYVLKDKAAVQQIMAVEAELLRSEGIDPEWPRFPETKRDLGDQK
jgi:hypothetical protein